MNKKTTPNGPRRPRPQHQFVVGAGEASGLLAYLVGHALKDKSRTSVKQLLADRFISVNQQATTQWDYALQEGDLVALHPSPLPSELHHKQVEILWQDEHLVLIHKGAGIPTVASGEERDETAMQVVSRHLKRFDPRAKVFLLNRIDKDSSGFVLMARRAELQAEMSEHWSRYVPTQRFVVVVEGQLAEAEGILMPPTEGDKQGRKPSRRVEGASMAGQARYRCLKQGEAGALLSVELLSGRNNRLRRQFAQMKRPIVGDWRNGSHRKDLGYVAIDSVLLELVHPITGKRYKFEQPIEGRLRRLINP